MPRPDYIAILSELVEKQVDFIVVGGVGAVLQGAPITTFDLDVHSTEQSNVVRLQAALESLGASPGHHLSTTRFGTLDLLGNVGKGQTYRDLIHQASALHVAEHLTVPVLGLASLIKLKEETAGEKDRAVLPILRRTLQERKEIFSLTVMLQFDRSPGRLP